MHQSQFFPLDRETEKAAKQNNKTAAVMTEVAVFGECGWVNVPTAKQGELTSQSGTFQCPGSSATSR